MTKLFDIDEGTNETPPRRQTNGQSDTHGFIWHSTTQELIPILPKDDPGYEENAKLGSRTPVERRGQMSNQPK